MTFVILLCLCASVSAEHWSWPDLKTDNGHRIDNKLSFADTPSQEESNRPNSVLSDDEQQRNAPYRSQFSGLMDDNYEIINYRNRRPNNDEWLNMYDDKDFRQCKCTTDTNCITRNDLQHTCAAGQRVCCYKRSGQDYINEANKRQYMLGVSPTGGFFSQNTPLLIGPAQTKRPVLIGPDGPTGYVGPSPIKSYGNHNYFQEVGPGGPMGIIGSNNQNQGILVGPDGPTGIIGPNRQTQDVLVGPEGPSGIIGPNRPGQGEGILVGPNGPTGIIGPNRQPQGVLVGPDGSAAIIGTNKPPQGILVGTEGPTGMIGPNRQVQGVLVGPNGPTGIIGPNRQAQAVLVGPGGPTGHIGPHRGGLQLGNANGARGVLVGPGGPTGIIGPVRGGYGLSSNSRLNGRHKYFNSDFSRFPSYRRGDIDI